MAGPANDKSEKWYFTKEELQNTPSRKNGIDADKELSYRQQAASCIQNMGQKLHVTQLCINTAIVYMHRFYMFHSFTHFPWNTIAAASLFLAAKVEEQPRKLEHVIKVALICLHREQVESFQAQCQDLVFNENILLQTLGFDVAIDHPHTHVVRCCHLVGGIDKNPTGATKELAQTSYFMATNSLHLTTMCLQYKPTVVACFCIHLACKWSNWEIPVSSEGKDWFYYVDQSVTTEVLEQLTGEFLVIFDKCPSRLRQKIMSISANQSPDSGKHSSSSSSPFDSEPRKITDIKDGSGSSRTRHSGIHSEEHRKRIHDSAYREYREKKNREQREHQEAHNFSNQQAELECRKLTAEIVSHSRHHGAIPHPEEHNKRLHDPAYREYREKKERERLEREKAHQAVAFGKQLPSKHNPSSLSSQPPPSTQLSKHPPPHHSGSQPLPSVKPKPPMPMQQQHIRPSATSPAASMSLLTGGNTNISNNPSKDQIREILSKESNKYPPSTKDSMGPPKQPATKPDLNNWNALTSKSSHAPPSFSTSSSSMHKVDPSRIKREQQHPPRKPPHEKVPPPKQQVSNPQHVPQQQKHKPPYTVENKPLPNHHSRSNGNQSHLSSQHNQLSSQPPPVHHQPKPPPPSLQPSLPILDELLPTPAVLPPHQPTVAAPVQQTKLPVTKVEPVTIKSEDSGLLPLTNGSPQSVPVQKRSLFSPDATTPPKKVKSSPSPGKRHMDSAMQLPTTLPSPLSPFSSPTQKQQSAPVNSSNTVNTKRTRSSSSSEPELKPVMKKLEQMGYEHILKEGKTSNIKIEPSASAQTPIATKETKQEKESIPLSQPLVNGIETNPTLISNLLKEAVQDSKSNDCSFTSEKIKPEHHKSSKKKKKEKHKHKDKDKSKDEKKKKHKDKEREKDKVKVKTEEEVTNTSTPIKITIAMNKPQTPQTPITTSAVQPETPTSGLKIKIPKDRLKTDSITETPGGSLKIKISKDAISGGFDSTGKKRERDKSSPMSALSPPPTKTPKLNSNTGGGYSSQQNGSSRNSYGTPSSKSSKVGQLGDGETPFRKLAESKYHSKSTSKTS